VTLDGPAGSGKSTTAREVAERLGFVHLDSGAIYRALTVALLGSGRPRDTWAELTKEDLQDIPIRVEVRGAELLIFLGDVRLTSELRTPEVTAHVSVAASVPAVRARLLGLQRQAGEGGGLVADGRDMGTVVFPDAELKVFLVADLEERARRRLVQDGIPNPGPEEVREEADRIRHRDAADSGRAVSPLRQPDGALVLDTTTLSFEEQVTRIESAARALMEPGSGQP
jgi:cytidylate kinase